MAELEYLERHKPLENKADMDADVDGHLRDRFWADYLRDISGQPIWAVRKACEWWRLLPEERFFPQSSQLRAKCLHFTEEVRQGKRVAEGILGYVPPGPVSTKDKISGEEWDVLREKMAEFCGGAQVDHLPSALLVKAQDHGDIQRRARTLQDTQTKRLIDLGKGVPL